MRLNILSDAHWESRVGKVLDELSSTGYRQLFHARDYGNGLSGITVVIVCQNPGLNLKPRVNFTKKEKKMYIDVMLSLDEMKVAAPDVRKQIVIERLENEVIQVLQKYSIKDFDQARFVDDFRKWIKSVN